MESIKILKRALKYKGEADLYLEEEIKKRLEEYKVSDKEAIIEKLNNNYDSDVIVQCYELLDSDKTGKTLKEYLSIKKENQ